MRSLVSRFVAALTRRSPLRMLLLLALLGLCLHQLSKPTTFALDSGDLTIRLVPDVPGGMTSLSLGPVGELSWHTHWGPMNIEARFVLTSSTPQLPGATDLHDLRLSLMARKIPWLLLAGAVVGFLAFGSGSRRRAIAAIGTGAPAFVVLYGLLVGISALTFNAKAFSHPRYEGPIEDAPRVMQLVREAQGDWQGVRRNINEVVVGLQKLHAQIVSDGTAPKGPTVRLLVISDVHDNPLGLLIAEQLIRQFSADAVLDAGDFTERGTEPEAELYARFSKFGVPHVVAPGNHEDTAAIDRLRAIRGVTVLESDRSDTSTIGGISVLGDSDPNAFFVDVNPRNRTAQEEIPAMCERLRERSAAVTPQVLLVHDPKLGECAAADAEKQDIPLVFVWGHLHRQDYEERGSVVSVSPGTSGAGGIKALGSAPYGFALLEFDPATKALTSTCLFQFDGPNRLRQASCNMRTSDETAQP